MDISWPLFKLVDIMNKRITLFWLSYVTKTGLDICASCLIACPKLFASLLTIEIKVFLNEMAKSLFSPYVRKPSLRLKTFRIFSVSFSTAFKYFAKLGEIVLNCATLSWELMKFTQGIMVNLAFLTSSQGGSWIFTLDIQVLLPKQQGTLKTL